MPGATVLPIVLVLLGLPLAFLGHRLLTLGLGVGCDFLIRYGGSGRALVKGRIPRSKVGEIMEFCSRDLPSAGAFTVRGTWGPNRVLKLRWSGRLAPGERQRVRNFLLQCLR